jgi:hypothetical protein
MEIGEKKLARVIAGLAPTPGLAEMAECTFRWHGATSATPDVAVIGTRAFSLSKEVSASELHASTI